MNKQPKEKTLIDSQFDCVDFLLDPWGKGFSNQEIIEKLENLAPKLIPKKIFLDELTCFVEQGYDTFPGWLFEAVGRNAPSLLRDTYWYLNNSDYPKVIRLLLNTYKARKLSESEMDTIFENLAVAGAVYLVFNPIGGKENMEELYRGTSLDFESSCFEKAQEILDYWQLRSKSKQN